MLHDAQLVMTSAGNWLSAALADSKTLFEHSVGFDSDALHVLIGFALQVLLALLSRRRLADTTVWLTVFLLELTNEANDLFREIWPQAAMQLGEGIKDILLTMAVPTLIIVLVRIKPALFADPFPDGDD